MMEQQYFFTVEDESGRSARVIVTGLDRGAFLKTLLAARNLTSGSLELVTPSFFRSKEEEELALSFLDIVLGPRFH